MMDNINPAALRFMQQLGADTGRFFDLAARYHQQLKVLKKQAVNSISFASSVHKAVDLLGKQYSKLHPEHAISCKMGCNFCCHVHVSITDSEADLLLHTAKTEGIAIDMPLLKRQAEASDHDEWSKIPYKHRSCVFLKEGICTNYASRPTACRKYFVITPPAECDFSDNRSREVEHTFNPHVEAISEAFLQADNHGSMAQKLYQKLNKKT